MNCITVTYPLIYQFKGYPHYKVTKCLKVFNTKTNNRIKLRLNGGAKGFWIGKTFLSLKNKTILEKIPKNNCPF